MLQKCQERLILGFHGNFLKNKAKKAIDQGSFVLCCCSSSLPDMSLQLLSEILLSYGKPGLIYLGLSFLKVKSMFFCNYSPLPTIKSLNWRVFL